MKEVPVAELRQRYSIPDGPKLAPTTEIAAFAADDNSAIALVVKEHVDGDYFVVVMKSVSASARPVLETVDLKIIGGDKNAALRAAKDMLNAVPVKS